MMRLVVAGAIGGYQRYVSPRKGFRCAHRSLHRGESCSAFGKRVVLEEGVFAFRRAMKARFLECKAAAMELRERRSLAMATGAVGPDGANADDAADGDDRSAGGKPGDRKKAGKSSGTWWCDVPWCDRTTDCDLPGCDCSW